MLKLGKYSYYKNEKAPQSGPVNNVKLIRPLLQAQTNTRCVQDDDDGSWAELFCIAIDNKIKSV